MRYSGVVDSISYLSSGEGSQKYYSAYISFAADEHVRLGMPAIVYLKDGAADVVFVDASCQTNHTSARIHIPVGSTESGKCRDEEKSVGVGNHFREVVTFLGISNYIELVAKPFDDTTCVEGGAL